MSHFLKIAAVIFLAAGLLVAAAQAKEPQTKCEMHFTMKSWSILYKSGKGAGTITCDNGQKADVHLRMHGGGLTIGKGRIVNGHGIFSKVFGIEELFGSYAAAEAHAGAVKSASAQALTKGEVSLTLTGTGQGFDIGLDFGSFKISKR